VACERSWNVFNDPRGRDPALTCSGLPRHRGPGRCNEAAVEGEFLSASVYMAIPSPPTLNLLGFDGCRIGNRSTRQSVIDLQKKGAPGVKAVGESALSDPSPHVQRERAATSALARLTFVSQHTISKFLLVAIGGRRASF
jgi:hypothetical protein